MVISGYFFILQTRLHSSVPRSSEDSDTLEALEDENRTLKSQLEEAKRGATRLSKERDELTRRLEERDLEREALKRGKSDLEEQKRLLDRALEKINKEVCMVGLDKRPFLLMHSDIIFDHHFSLCLPLPLSDGDDDGRFPSVSGRSAVTVG